MILFILVVILIVICVNTGNTGSCCDDAMMWYWLGYWDRDRHDPYF